MTQHGFRWLFWGMLLCTSILLLFSVMAIRQRQSFTEAHGAEQRGEVAHALAAYGSTIRLDYPFSPLTSKASTRLWQIAVNARETGDDQTARNALLTLRSAWYAIQRGKSSSPWVLRTEQTLAPMDRSNTNSPPERSSQ
jgi:hypothetical protein